MHPFDPFLSSVIRKVKAAIGLEGLRVEWSPRTAIETGSVGTSVSCKGPAHIMMSATKNQRQKADLFALVRVVISNEVVLNLL